MKLSIRDLDLQGRRVFIRVDFNVPLKDGVIGDDTRIRSSLPTIKYALDHGATVVLASHLGRPKGKATAELSLRPIADRLFQHLQPPAGDDDGVTQVVKAVSECLTDTRPAARDEDGVSGRFHVNGSLLVGALQSTDVTWGLLLRDTEGGAIAAIWAA